MMKKRVRGVLGFFIVLSAGSAFAISDPMWIFADKSNVPYSNFRYCDTARDADVICFALESDQLPDSGVSMDGSKYINFPYQFNTNPVIVRDKFDSTVIKYQSSARPGFAGFKTAWDYGMTGFPLPRFKYLILDHLGPLSNHKVKIKFWYNNGGCGVPSFCDDIGSFTSSSTWRTDTIVIPDSIRLRPDALKDYKYYEMVFIINNADPASTAMESAKGLLKVDNIRLVGANLPVGTPATKKSGCGGGFALAFIPPMCFKARAMLKRKKRNGRSS